MPAMSCSLYTIASEMELEDLRSKLENVSFEEQMVVYEEIYPLRTFISDIHWGDPEKEVLSGVLSFETLQPIYQIEEKTTYVRAGTRVMFSAFEEPASLNLAIFANRYQAESSANRINNILTRGKDVPEQIVFNRRITPTSIEQFLANNPHTKKMGGWEDLNFVGVSKGSLHGSDIDQFDQTQRYDSHGRKSYVMVTLHHTRMTVRISVEGIVTFYGNINKVDALKWIRQELGSFLT